MTIYIADVGEGGFTLIYRSKLILRYLVDYTYPLSNDETEMVRLDEMERVFRNILGENILTPLDKTGKRKLRTAMLFRLNFIQWIWDAGTGL
jgi:hypothetical protein